jgi:phenylpropionate dioxygenase-like ring-hydroxylating dioxygenase large terminal subunit
MNYIRNAGYVAGWAPDFETNKPVGVTFLGDRSSSGENALTALGNRCVHRLAPLSSGDLIPPNAKVRAYPIRERHSPAYC